MERQRGFALLEAIAVVAIVSICAGGLLMSISASAKLGASSRNRTAATILAAQTLRTAETAWKYGALGDAPSGSVPASMPVPGSDAGVPVTISSAISSVTADGAAITITVSYPPSGIGNDSGVVTVTGALRVKAPLPGAQLAGPDLIPQPSGAP